MAFDFQQPRPVAGATTTGRITRFDGEALREAEDVLATEEPLEIRLGFEILGRPAERSVCVTMRTPGEDRELAVGFLIGESVIRGAEEIESIAAMGDPNILRVKLRPEVSVDVGAVQRNFYTTSSCGVCGKASLEALTMSGVEPIATGDLTVPASLVGRLPEALREAQEIFGVTGGVHAAGLFDGAGNLLGLREDVGRHNAMDKLVGAMELGGEEWSAGEVLVLSGRASFELLQKAIVAGIPVVVAVGAPSSLARELAEAFGVTLIGFARPGRFNIYAHAERIRVEEG